MNVELTPDQRAFVQKAIESGRFTREEEAVHEALALSEGRERRRLEIIAMIDEAAPPARAVKNGSSRKNRHRLSSRKPSGVFGGELLSSVDSFSDLDVSWRRGELDTCQHRKSLLCTAIPTS